MPKSLDDQRTIDTLNELLALHYRSLPMYLADAKAWTHRGDEAATAAVHDIVESHRVISRRLAEEIQRRDGVVNTGEFPDEWTDLHDLSLDYLLGLIIADLDEQIEAIRSCIDRLERDPTAKALAEESLGNARGHRQTLSELLASLAVKL